MPHPNILLAFESESLAAEIAACLKAGGLDLHLHHLKTAEEMARHCTLQPFDMVVADAACTTLPPRTAFRIARGAQYQCKLFAVFDTLDEAAVSRVIHQGATSFALRSHLDGLAAQITASLYASRQMASQCPVNARQILNAFLEESSDSLWVKNRNGEYLLINPAGARFLGKPVEEIIGKTDHDLFAPETAEKIIASDRHVMASGLTQTIEDLLITRGGVDRTFEAVKGVFRDEHGQVQGILGTVRDISARKRTENALRESEQRFRLLVDGVKDHAIYMTDRHGNVTTWNIGAERLQGYKSEEIAGRHFSCFYPMSDSLEDDLDEALLEAIEKGFYEQEGWSVRKDGTTFWASVIITPLYSDRPELIGFSNVVRDMSERRQARQELQYYADELEQSNRELEQFALIASHDLQAPLRKIQTFSELLRKHVSPEGQDIARRLHASAEKMHRFITDLLALSCVNRNGNPLAPVQLEPILSGVLDDLLMFIRESQADISVGKLGTVYGDPLQLSQVFLNLISNGIKFRRPDTPPRIRVRGEMLLNGFYQITVQDNGIGFKEEHLERIFRPFERLHGESDYAGTGMGLAICQKIIHRHGGQITATSQEGVGSTFIIYLPTRQAAEPAEQDAHSLQRVG